MGERDGAGEGSWRRRTRAFCSCCLVPLCPCPIPRGPCSPCPPLMGLPGGFSPIPQQGDGRPGACACVLPGLARQGTQWLPQRIHQTPLSAPSPLKSSPEVLAALIEVEAAPVSGWGEGRGGCGAPPRCPPLVAGSARRRPGRLRRKGPRWLFVELRTGCLIVGGNN